MPSAVITGANRGIGLELVKQYIANGFQVYGLCRKNSDALKQTGAIVIENMDLSSADAIQNSLKKLKGVGIDILINNAGVLADESLQSMSASSIEYQFKVNSLAPLLVTQTLKEQFNPGAKVGLITSRMGSMADNSSGGRYGYRMSKAALNIAGVSLAHDLKPLGTAVAILHPGYVQTDMVNHNGDISAAEAAKRLVNRMNELNLTNTGTFWHSNGEILPW
ncbi:SDR family oxidoreductase [Paraglaciecola sp. 2405UD69-4]|uniref:SDR family oxidoreductase n=1 Tax=Paraglaciecola sp. 2405UD69-4 TaxID=3391836 RepID=UPI0039C8DABE